MNGDYTLTEPAVAAFVWIAVFLAGALVSATGFSWRRSGARPADARRAAMLTTVGAAAWMGSTWLLAAWGVLQRWDRMPPPFALMVAAMVTLAGYLAFGQSGTRIALEVPLWLLVGIQGFRLPLELAMHVMYERGIMPVQMSYSGLNFDILTGASALVVAALIRVGVGGRRLAFWWNIAGLALLVNVVTVAVLATPVIAAFGEEHLNVWVTYVPFVWLPAVMVLAALAGHLLVFRALRLNAR